MVASCRPLPGVGATEQTLRIMFYGLQNSGATLVALFAGQRPGSVVLPDLFTMYCAPRVDDDLDVCLKVTVTTAFPLEQHIRRFRPDHVFLVVRRPVDNAVSLRRKPFARHDGTVEEKFQVADGHFVDPRPFTDVIHFEDFVDDHEPVQRMLDRLGWHLPSSAAEFNRSSLDMENDIWRMAPRLYEQVQWGPGQARVAPLPTIRLGAAEDPAAEQFCRQHAPHLHEHYQDRERSGLVPSPVRVRRTAQDESALQARTNFVANHLAIFEGFLRQNAPQEALEVTDELLALAPDVAAVWTARARALELNGSPYEARSALVEAIESSPEPSELRRDLRLALASHLLRTGDITGCGEIAAALLSDHPDLTAAHMLSAEVALRERRFEETRSHALRVLETDPSSVNARRLVAEGLNGLGDVSEACEWLRSALLISPEFQVARRRLEVLEPTPPV